MYFFLPNYQRFVSSSEDEDMHGSEEEDVHDDHEEEHVHDSEEDGREQDHWNANGDEVNQVHIDSRSHPTLPRDLAPPARRFLAQARRCGTGTAPSSTSLRTHGRSALQLQTSRQPPSAAHLRTTAARPVIHSLLVGREAAIGNLNPQFLIWWMCCEMAGCPQFLI
jgi:hypothetical protein